MMQNRVYLKPQSKKISDEDLDSLFSVALYVYNVLKIIKHE